MKKKLIFGAAGIALLFGFILLIFVLPASAEPTPTPTESPTMLPTVSPNWIAMNSGVSGPLYGIWGTSADDIFAVGGNGTILHYNGSVWCAMASGTSRDLYGVWGSSSGDVFAVGHSVDTQSPGTILHYNGSSWLGMGLSTGNYTDYNDVWGYAWNDVYAVGFEWWPRMYMGLLVHYNGSEWVVEGFDTDNMMEGIWGSSANDIYAVGIESMGFDGSLIHYKGTSWDEDLSPRLWDVCGGPCGTNYAVGSDYGGGVFITDGLWPTPTVTPVSPTPSPPPPPGWSRIDVDTNELLFGVWVSNSCTVFAVGGGGFIIYYDGECHEMYGPTSQNLYDVWGSSASDVYAVGGNGTILHYWEAPTATPTPTLTPTTTPSTTPSSTITEPPQPTATMTPCGYIFINSTAGGSVVEPGEGYYQPPCGFPDPTVVDLLAVAESGYSFDVWTGDVGGIDDIYAANTTIDWYMGNTVSITANFILSPTPTVSITPTPTATPGPGDVNDDGVINCCDITQCELCILDPVKYPKENYPGWDANEDEEGPNAGDILAVEMRILGTWPP